MDGNTEKEVIETIRSLLGNHEALLEYLQRLQRPLSPIIREYLEAHVGAWGEREIEYYFRIRRKRDGLYSGGGMSPFFSDKGKTWRTLGALSSHLSQFKGRWGGPRENPYMGCVVVKQKVVTYTETQKDFSLDGGVEEAQAELKEDAARERKKRKPQKTISTKRLQVGTVYESKRKTAVFLGWARKTRRQLDVVEPTQGKRVMVWFELSRPYNKDDGWSEEQLFQLSYTERRGAPRNWYLSATTSHSYTKALCEIEVAPLDEHPLPTGVSPQE